MEQLETATYFVQKSTSLLQVIQGQNENAHFAKDRDGVEALKEQVAAILKHKMVDAMGKDDVAVIRKIACLFRSVDKQDEGMKHYTNYIMQHKTLKSLDAVIKAMYLPKDSSELINLSESFA